MKFSKFMELKFEHPVNICPIFSTLLVSILDKLIFSKEVQFPNIFSIFLREEISRKERSNSTRKEHPENILSKEVVLAVSKPCKFIEINEWQLLNKYFIDSILVVSIFVIFIYFKLWQSENI